MMKISGPARLTDDKVLAPGQVATVVKATIKKFCYSADERIGRHHVPNDLKRFTEDEIAALRTFIPAIAQRLWERHHQRDGTVPMDYDYYLKAFALTHPVLPGDVIALDEAQDSNPCCRRDGPRAERVRHPGHHGRRHLPGDLRVARCPSTRWSPSPRQPGVQVLSLTQSFRFGEAVAAEGNKLLTDPRRPAAAARVREDRIARRQDPRRERCPDAMLCRTNAEAMRRPSTRSAAASTSRSRRAPVS